MNEMTKNHMTAQIDPFTRDRTWCGHKERELADRDKLHDRFCALALSATIRNNRD